MAKRLKLRELLDVLEKTYGKPRTAEHAEAPLLDHLLVGVLSAWVDREKAARSVRAISEAFLDLNEARVSPLAELTAVLHPWLGAKAPEAALAARTALQDVFDGTHGLDLEPLRGREPDDLRKFLRELPHTMGGPAAAIFQLALGTEQLALMPAVHRVLDRLKLLPNAATPQKVRQALEKQVKPAVRLDFAWSVGSHAGSVCPKVPLCETCMLLPNCPFGDAEVKKRELERKKDEARRAADEKRKRLIDEKNARIAARLVAADAKKKALADAKAARIALLAKQAADKKAKAIQEKKDKLAAEKAAKLEAIKAAKAAKADAIKAEKAKKAAAAKKAAKK